METVRDSRDISRARTASDPGETISAPHTQHGTKLQDILMAAKPNLSYADFHRELTKNPDASSPKNLGKQRSHTLGRSSLKEEELVRYMSNLPSYLERGKNSQEKALNVGVLDWKRLEKWRCNQPQMPPKPNGHSPSSSNTSLFSTDGSSTHSSRGRSSSPARQRLQRTTMKSAVEASSKERHVQDAKSSSGIIPQEIPVFGGNTNKFQDSVANTGILLCRQYNNITAAPLCERKRSDSIPDKYEGAGTWKGKKKIQDVEFTRSKETTLNAGDRDSSGRDKSGVIIMPRDPMEQICPNFTGSASITANDRLSVEPGEKTLLVSNKLGNQQSSINGKCNQFEPNVYCTRNEPDVHNSSQSSHISHQSTTMRLPTPSRIRMEKKPVMLSGEFDAVRNSEAITKARNPSPIRRLSFAMSKMIKNVGPRDNSPLRRANTKDCIAKSGSDAVNSSLSTDNHCSNNYPANTIRGKSSPLRRLLDPLLKPRVSNCSEPPNKQPSSTIDALKSRSNPSDSRPKHSIAVNLRSERDSKNGPSSLQALLQISFKNGLPLFTFAINNEKNILAATVRKSIAPGKGHYTWIYTFFAIHEVKRKTGSWLGKSSNPSVVPNVVAQMKVFDSYTSSLNTHKNPDDVISREFDLFAVDVSQGNECPTDFHPTNELAAVIVKLPLITNESKPKPDHSSYDWLDNSGGDPELYRSLLNLNLNATVILPGGVHTIPSKGEISRLVQRWKSGGVCDCGGWDLGCQLRVYGNKKEDQTKFDSSGNSLSKEKLQLFSRVGQDTHPILSLAPFKERIYSVEFNSSLSLLQAFAVSISFIDCQRPPSLSEPNNAPEKVTSELPIRSTISNQAEPTGRYVSYPPHSPVERV